jgi:hypothetical protein
MVRLDINTPEEYESALALFGLPAAKLD